MNNSFHGAGWVGSMVLNTPYEHPTKEHEMTEVSLHHSVEQFLIDSNAGGGEGETRGFYPMPSARIMFP